MDIRARYGALRILGIGHDAQLLCHDLHHAGYSVAGLYPEESATGRQEKSAPINRSGRRLIDPRSLSD
jgi:hypothetical protein